VWRRLWGLAGVVANFGLFYTAERIFHLSREMIQSLIYLKLSVAGPLTIFAARTEKAMWSVRPATTLVAAIFVAQSVATLFAVYRVFMTPIGWDWARFRLGIRSALDRGKLRLKYTAAGL
jgi:H+-transporting ATPase